MGSGDRTAELDHVLAGRVNAPPKVFFGLTAPEFMMIGLGSIGIMFLPALLIGMAIGMMMVALSALPVLAMGVLFVAGKILAGFKRGKPDGFVGHVMELRLARLGLRKPGFRRHDGPLALGRTRPVQKARS